MNQVNMPSTHDSFAFEAEILERHKKIGTSIRTQTLNTAQQLSMGVRMFDARLNGIVMASK